MKSGYSEIVLIILLGLIAFSCVQLDGNISIEKKSLSDYLDKIDITLQIIVDTMDNITEHVIANEEEIKKLKGRIHELEAC